MINALFDSIIDLIFFMFRWISNILLLPLTGILNIIKLLFPSFQEFENTAYYFVDEYLFKAIAFGKEVFFNLTGFPILLIQISVTIATELLIIIATLKIITFVLNIYRILTGGKTDG